jgi:hypothetical protein
MWTEELPRLSQSETGRDPRTNSQIDGIQRANDGLYSRFPSLQNRYMIRENVRMSASSGGMDEGLYYFL